MTVFGHTVLFDYLEKKKATESPKSKGVRKHVFVTSNIAAQSVSIEFPERALPVIQSREEI